MSLIIPANTLASGGFAVDNSCRFNRASSDYLTRSTGTPDSRRIATFSVWVKRGDLSASDNMDLFCITTDTTKRVHIRFQGDDIDIINYDGTTNARLTTDRKFRDISAWYHIVVVLDSTQGTAANRMKLYINGVQETSFSTATYPTLNFDFDLNFTNTQIGKSDVGTAYFGGYMSEVLYLDGTAAAITDLGEFDEDSGIWKPIDVSGLTFGTNGFYLDFESSGSLGADVSGNTNNFTVNNLTAIDQTTDTPTNNFCTMNPLYPDGTITFSEGNLKLTEGAAWRSAGGTMAVSTGKWYWEVLNVGNYAYIGFADIQLFSDGCSIRESFTTAAATTGRAHSVGNSDGRHYQVTSGGAQSSEYPAGATFPSFTNSIIGVALNLDDNNFLLYKDGTVMNPSGTAISITAGTYIPAVSIYSNNVSMNFGSPPYSESGGNSDGNGHGNFSMSVPSGYLSLCTSNLSEVLG